MAEDGQYGDTSRVADHLWGPRHDEDPASGTSPPVEQLWEPRHDGAPGPTPAATEGDPPMSPDSRDVGADPTSQFEVLRSQLEAAFAAELAKVRSETMAAIEARLESVEADVRERLDSLARKAADAADKAMALTSVVQAHWARVEALAEHVDREMPRLVEVIEAAGAEAVARAGIGVDPPFPADAGGSLEAVTGGPLQSELDALRAQLAWARAEIRTTVATTESLAVAAEARVAQQLELIVEQARSEATAAPPGTRTGPSANQHRRLRERVSALDRAVAELQGRKPPRKKA